MSIKTSLFLRQLPAPKTLESYYVCLPGDKYSMLRVSAASLPYPSLGEGVISFMGKKLYVPTEQITDGEWTCTYEEDATLAGHISISHLQKLASSRTMKPGDIMICLIDQITGKISQLAVTLGYCFLKKVDPVQLDWSKPTETIKYKLTFRYSSIKRWY